MDVAGWPVPRRGDALEETDGASRFLGGRYERYVAGSLDRSSLAWPDDEAPEAIPRSASCPADDSFMVFRLLSPEPCWLATSILFTGVRGMGILGSWPRIHRGFIASC